MTYQAQFHHIGVQTVKSEIFPTFQAAHACAAQHQPEIKADAVFIVEIDKSGNEGRSHRLEVI